MDKRFLFVCVHNSGRSQMAEAFFNQFATGKATASSAGTQPTPQINPTVVQVMREEGLDINDKKPKLRTLEMMKNTDRVITMGCGEEKVCPASFIPTEDWQLEDPEGKPINEVRKIRDVIKTKMITLIKEIHTEGSVSLKRSGK